MTDAIGTAPSVAGEAWFQDARLRRVLDLLNGEGSETRIVGGAVRNSLMGFPVADVDLATTLLPKEVVALAVTAGIKAVPTGIEHGTVTLVVDGKPFEVTTLRRDVKTNGRHAEVEFGTSWQEDAARRDLTINGLYANRDGEVIDLVDGLRDIERGTVRFIGDAAERVEEDYLRVLRFFRFFAYYGQFRPDADGLRASARAKDKLKTLSAERVWSELKKLLGAPDPGRALLWMRQSGVLTEILPESEKWGIDAIPSLIETGTALGWPADPMLRLAAIVPQDSERLAGLAQRLRLSRAEAGWLQSVATAPAIKPGLAGTALDRLLYRHGEVGPVARLRLAIAAARASAGGDPARMAEALELQGLLKRAEQFSRPVLPVTGADLIAAGIPAGPRLGEILARMENHWVERNFTPDRADLLDRLADFSARD